MRVDLQLLIYCFVLGGVPLFLAVRVLIRVIVFHIPSRVVRIAVLGPILHYRFSMFRILNVSHLGRLVGRSDLRRVTLVHDRIQLKPIKESH